MSQNCRELEDKELVERMIQGDPDAWRQFYETYGKPLFIYVYHKIGGDPSAADDVRQETLVAVIEAIASYRREVPLFAWLCGIARRKVADEFRHRKRESIPLENLNENTRQMDSKVIWHQLGKEPLPDEIVERAETKTAIVEALWCLPKNYREALIARYVREESVDKMALRLGRSYKATESLLSRAREAFRSRLMEVEQGDNQ